MWSPTLKGENMNLKKTPHWLMILGTTLVLVAFLSACSPPQEAPTPTPT